MKARERIIRLWFEMWLRQEDLGMDAIFAEDVIYTESWGPVYHGRGAVMHWFAEWNGRGKVVTWNIKQFFHKDHQTVVEWYFENHMNNGRIEAFDGISLIQWTEDQRIQSLKEFGCNCDCYDPYENGETPQFREEQMKWF